MNRARYSTLLKEVTKSDLEEGLSSLNQEPWITHWRTGLSGYFDGLPSEPDWPNISNHLIGLTSKNHLPSTPVKVANELETLVAKRWIHRDFNSIG